MSDKAGDVGDTASEVKRTLTLEDMGEPPTHLSSIHSLLEHKQNTSPNLDLFISQKTDEGYVSLKKNNIQPKAYDTSIAVQNEEPVMSDGQVQSGDSSSKVQSEPNDLIKYVRVNGHNEANSINNDEKSVGRTEENVLTLCGVADDGGNESRESNEREALEPLSLNFGSPLLALDFKREFDTTNNNYTKGCKWYVYKILHMKS